jgi:integrin alpha 8
MRKFEEYAPCKNSMWGYHRQGFCQAGFSAALSQVNYLNNKKKKFIKIILFQSTSSLILSGPGAWYWQGMIFSLNLTTKEIKNRYPEKSGEGNEDDSYRGYSLDIGQFDNDSFEGILI